VTRSGAEVSAFCMIWKAYQVNVTLSQNSISWKYLLEMDHLIATDKVLSSACLKMA